MKFLCPMCNTLFPEWGYEEWFETHLIECLIFGECGQTTRNAFILAKDVFNSTPEYINNLWF